METLYDFLDRNDLYIVMLIVLVIWALIYFYLFRLDKKITRLEQSTIDNKK